MIRLCGNSEFELIYAIINNGALVYKGVIPEDCWTEPYMSRDELQHEIGAGVVFWGSEESGTLGGVMGLQSVQDVTLIRHAYVLGSSQRRGIGGRLLSRLRELTKTPILIGTWADAFWAIRFYEKHGFQLVEREQKNRLLMRYWTVPQRQAEVSVVLADAAWRELNGERGW
jgi:GNAT superfamily N-acetyltransferase